MVEDLHGVSSHTGRIKTTRKGGSVHSEEARVWRTALSMSSASYSGFNIQEPIHRKRNVFITARNISSSGKAEQYVIPPFMEQLRGLPQKSDVIGNVRSRDW
jgi:hypothetical protein